MKHPQQSRVLRPGLVALQTRHLAVVWPVWGVAGAT